MSTNGFDFKKHTVIVAEDEGFTRQTLVRLLTSMGATKVVQAEDGEAALAESWTIEAGPAIVISDFNMPKIDGLELLKSIRMGQCGLDRAAPFIMLTAYSDRDLVDVALKLDVSAFLVKPVSRAALEKRLNHLARTEQDKNWLKSISVYEAVSTEVSDEVLHPSNPDQKPAPLLDPKLKKGARKAGAGAVPDDEEEGKTKISAEASEAGAELLKLLLSKTEDEGTEVDETSQAEFVARLTASFGDKVKADTLVRRIEGLSEGLGQAAAGTVLAAVDRLERGGTLKMEDVVGILASGDEKHPPESQIAVASDWRERSCTLGALPSSAVTAQDIFTPQGGLLIAAGTRLNATVLQLLGVLEQRNELDLPTDAQVGRPTLRVLAPPEPAAAPEPARPRMPVRPIAPRPPKGPERSLNPTEIQPGFVLSRDIHTSNGALYLGAGTTLTERHVGVLDSLYETGKLTAKIWISAGPPK